MPCRLLKSRHHILNVRHRHRRTCQYFIQLLTEFLYQLRFQFFSAQFHKLPLSGLLINSAHFSLPKVGCTRLCRPSCPPRLVCYNTAVCPLIRVWSTIELPNVPPSITKV